MYIITDYNTCIIGLLDNTCIYLNTTEMSKYPEINEWSVY